MDSTSLTKCEACAKEISEEAQFCPNCGKDSPFDATKELKEQLKKELNIKKPLTSIELIFAITVSIVMFYILINHPEIIENFFK